MKKLNAEDLIQKYAQGNATPDEQLLVEQWFLKDLETSAAIPDEQRIMEADQRMMSGLTGHLEKQQHPVKKIRLWPRIAAAAVVLFILAVGTFFLFLKTNQSEQMVQVKSKDILPGGNKAVLTLANGKKIILTNAANGNLAKQGNTSITKTKEGEVSYQNSAASPGNAAVYNTMSTPRGGTYHLILSDGTVAILNAASSITYPTSFSGAEREVTTTGEVYFEVAHNPACPFRVISRGQTVEVLGTHFNVNAYHEELAVRTTLLEGSVKVTNTKHQTIFLQPGEQAEDTRDLTLVKNADIEEAIAWKNGFFHFNNADIPTVMRQLARWYDVAVEYEGTDTGRRFTGDIHRDMNASKALEVLSYLKIQFRIEGKKIIVIQ